MSLNTMDVIPLVDSMIHNHAIFFGVIFLAQIEDAMLEIPVYLDIAFQLIPCQKRREWTTEWQTS